jgi:hypothetical protein
MSWESFLPSSLLFLLMTSAAGAAEPAAGVEEQPCVALANTIGLNYSRYLDVDQQRAVAKADMCSESYSKATRSQQAQIEVGYKLFSGSASASAEAIQEAQSKHCENHFGEYWRNQIKAGEARTVSSEGAAVIAACLDLTFNNLFPTLTIANNGKEVVMAGQYNQAPKGRLP